MRLKLKTKIALASVARWIECDCGPKGHRFDSQAGHMPGLWARSPVGVCEWQPHIDVSLSLSPALPLSLKISKLKKIKSRKGVLKRRMPWKEVRKKIVRGHLLN